MATTLLCCSHLAETFNQGRPTYYRVERDGWDELRMRGLVQIDKSSIGWVRVCRKGCSRPCMECVSRVGQDSIGQGGGWWDGKGLDVVQYGGGM